MKAPRYNFWLLLFFLLTLIALFSIRMKAQALSLDILPSRTIEVAIQVPADTPVPKPPWTYLEKLQEAKDLVASSSLDLKVGKTELTYYENRISRNSNGQIQSVTLKKLNDPEREIALVLLDTENGNLEILEITERGNELTYPNGYSIRNVERSNGITNNAWNTCRQVLEPENKVIILNVWPHYVDKKIPRAIKDKRGKVIRTVYDTKQVVENVVYSPYCDQIHISEFVENGKNYRESISGQAYQILRERGVVSKAFPGRLIADLEYLKPEYFERLPLIEHMDYGEFTLDSRKSAERVDVLLGTNLEQAYNLTCSKAKACGWLQYTKTTWNAMKSKYPSAKLPVFETGVKDHTMSMVAAILLYDNNLNAAIKAFGSDILDDRNQLEEMLAANYNGGTVRPHKALRASILQSLADWLINPMRTETKQYIEKLRYIRSTYN